MKKGGERRRSVVQGNTGWPLLCRTTTVIRHTRAAAQATQHFPPNSAREAMIPTLCAYSALEIARDTALLRSCLWRLLWRLSWRLLWRLLWRQPHIYIYVKREREKKRWRERECTTCLLVLQILASPKCLAYEEINIIGCRQESANDATLQIETAVSSRGNKNMIS